MYKERSAELGVRAVGKREILDGEVSHVARRDSGEERRRSVVVVAEVLCPKGNRFWQDEAETATSKSSFTAHSTLAAAVAKRGSQMLKSGDVPREGIEHFNASGFPMNDSQKAETARNEESTKGPRLAHNQSTRK